MAVHACQDVGSNPRDLVAQPVVTVTNGRFTYAVPYGVTTFVGTGTATPSRCTGDCNGNSEVTID